jgi:hypothetical protein
MGKVNSNHAVDIASQTFAAPVVKNHRGLERKHTDSLPVAKATMNPEALLEHDSEWAMLALE